METPDFRTVICNLAKELTTADVSRLKKRIRGAEFCASDKSHEFIFFLEEKHLIHERNLSPLILALKAENLSKLAEDLEKYEENTPLSSDSKEFVGRNDELSRMRNHASECQPPELLFRGIFVSGMPGIGKTSLVNEFCRSHRFQTYGFKETFISCRGLSSASSLLEVIKEKFGIIEDFKNSFKRFHRKLDDPKWKFNRLIVMDNVEDVMEADEANFNQLLLNLVKLLKRNERIGCCLLITSRKRLANEMFESLQYDFWFENLELMTESDSIRLIKHYLKQRQLLDADKISLMNHCGRHPLSMALVAHHLSLPSPIPFSIIEDNLSGQLLPSLAHFKDFVTSDNSESIVKSLLHVFNCLDDSAKDLLVRLSLAPSDMTLSTMKKLFMDPSADLRQKLSNSLTRLKESNLISISASLEKKFQRISMHLLIKKFLAFYCKSPGCPASLQQAYQEAEDLLITAYEKEMVKLSEKQFRGCDDPVKVSSKIRSERANFTPLLSTVLDSMVSKVRKLDDLESICRFRPHLIVQSAAVADFYRKRWKTAESCHAPWWVTLFFEMKFVDASRMAGHSVDKKLFDMKENLDKRNASSNCRDDILKWLNTHFNRLYGRYLKDSKELKEKKKSITYLTKALNGFRDSSLFPNFQGSLIEVYHDLGNAHKDLADQEPRVPKHLKQAKESFNHAREICERKNLKMPWLFDLHVSLAIVEMDLSSGAISPTGTEDSMTMANALHHFEQAERLADEIGDEVTENDVRMGNLYYPRALCHVRAEQFTAAYADAKRALKFRKSVFGRHQNTMNVYSLLGYICLCIKNMHVDQAMQYLEASFAMAKSLAKRGATIDPDNLDRLNEYLWLVCPRVRKDPAVYEKALQEIKDGDTNELIEGTSDEDSSSENETKDTSKFDFPDSCTSDSDLSEDSSPPGVRRADDLGKKLKSLVDENAGQLRLADEHPVALYMQVKLLQYGYSSMNDEERRKTIELAEASIERLEHLQREGPPHNESQGRSLFFLVAAAGLLMGVLFYICRMFFLHP